MHLAQRSFDIPFALLCFIYIPIIRTLASLFISYIVQSQNPTHPHPHTHKPQPHNLSTKAPTTLYRVFPPPQESKTTIQPNHPPIHTFLQQTTLPFSPLPKTPPLLYTVNPTHSLTNHPHPTPKSHIILNLNLRLRSLCSFIVVVVVVGILLLCLWDVGMCVGCGVWGCGMWGCGDVGCGM